MGAAGVARGRASCITRGWLADTYPYRTYSRGGSRTGTTGTTGTTTRSAALLLLLLLLLCVRFNEEAPPRPLVRGASTFHP